MWQRLVFLALVAAIALVPDRALPQEIRGGLIPQMLARRCGLERAWFAQVVLDDAYGGLGHITQHVSSKRSVNIYELAYDGGELLITERTLDRFGVALGRERAKKTADDKAAELKAAGLNPKLTSRAIPEITLFVTTERGVVQAIDGETGRTRWITAVGNRGYLTSEAGANEEYVGVINGSTLYVLAYDSGELKWERRARGVPGAGPALSDVLVFVPTITGALEMLDLADHRKTLWPYMFTGRAVTQPVVSARSVAWTTDDGRLFVAKCDQRGIRFRLGDNGEITSPPAFFSPERLLAASDNGDLFCIHEINGDVYWRFSTGQSIRQAPIVIGDAIYLCTDEGGLFRVSVDAGVQKWWMPGIRQFVAASEKRIYCVGDTGRLLVLDAESGGRIGELSTEIFDHKLANSTTDRVFVATSSGLIQCLREIQLRWPLVHVVPEETAPAKPKEGGGAESQPAAAVKQPVVEEPPKEEDPFSGAVKKAGASKAPPAKEEKPAEAAKAPPAKEEKPAEAGKAPSASVDNPFK